MMGWDYEVSYWQENTSTYQYEYVHYWGGNSYRTALQRLKECRAKGYGCVKLKCRNNPADAGKERSE